MAVVINGRDLTVEEVIRVCRQNEKVEIAPEAKKAVQKARDYIEKKLEEGAVIYGGAAEKPDHEPHLHHGRTLSETVRQSGHAAALQCSVQR